MRRPGPCTGWHCWLGCLKEELEDPATVSSLDRITSRIFSKAHLQPGDRVVDLGAGTGLITKMAALNVLPDGVVTAVDASKECLELLSSDFDRSGIVNYRAVPGYVEDLPFDSAFFDVALSRSALCYSSDIGTAVAQMSRVLKPKGRFSLFEPLTGEMEWTGEPGERFLAVERILKETRGPGAIDRMRIRQAFEESKLSNESLVVHYGLDMEGRSIEELLREYLFDLPGELSAFEVLKRSGKGEAEIMEVANYFARLAAAGKIKCTLPCIFIWGSK